MSDLRRFRRCGRLGIGYRVPRRCLPASVYESGPPDSVYAPGLISGLDPLGARILGGALFLFLLQLHILLFVVRVNKEDVTERLMALHQDYQVYQDQLEQSRVQTEKLRELVSSNELGQNKEIVNEMKLLQTLLAQVVEKSAGGRAAVTDRQEQSLEV